MISGNLNFWPTRRTLTDKVKDFYKENRDWVIGGVMLLTVTGAIGTCAVYNGKKSLDYFYKNKPVLERAADMPRSEDKDLRFNYEKAYGQYWKAKKK